MTNIIEIILSARDEASSTIDSTFQNLQGAGQIAIGAFAAIGAGAVAAGAGIMTLARSGAGLQDVQNSFAAMAQNAGTSSQAMLASMQQASGGMIDQQTLMLEYNNASTIMGGALAGRIPEAMQYLDRISDATGRSTTGMIDSLINSVGRLRPTMLAQMGITVDATTAYDTYAASIGKTADQLTEGEQQTALFNAAVESLRTTAEGLPDVANSAGDSFAIMDTNIANLGQNISTLFIPAGQKMADGIGRIAGIANTFAQNVGAKGASGAIHDFFTNYQNGEKGSPLAGLFESFGLASDAADTLAIPLNAVGDSLITLFDRLSMGEAPLGVITSFFNDLAGKAIIPPELATGINDFITGVSNVVTPIANWLAQNVQLSDVLTAFGIAISTVVIPAVIALAAPFLPIIATFGALVVGIALLRQAWETDFGGIQTFVTTQVFPAISHFFEWLGGVWTNTVEPNLQKLYQWFTETALPAVVSFIQTTVIPAVQKFTDWLGDVWETAEPFLSKLYDWFTKSAMPAIVDFLQNKAGPIIIGIKDFLVGIWELGGDALQKLQKWFTGSGIDKNIEGISDKVRDFQNWLSGLWHNVQPTLQPLLDFFSGILHDAGTALNSILNLGSSASGGSATQYGGTNYSATGSGTPNNFNNDIHSGGGIGAPSRDTGGFGTAGQPYLIGAGAQPEMFIPGADGRFIPNADRLGGGGGGGDGGGGGITITSLTVHANSRAEGEAAAEGLLERLEAERRRVG